MDEIIWKRTGGKTHTVTMVRDAGLSPLSMWAEQMANAAHSYQGQLYSALGAQGMNVCPTCGRPHDYGASQSPLLGGLIGF